jgi:addiction module HigA family antidote
MTLDVNNVTRYYQ